MATLSQAKKEPFKNLPSLLRDLLFLTRRQHIAIRRLADYCLYLTGQSLNISCYEKAVFSDLDIIH
ncbi:MAG: hypothetical protein P8100_03920 [bacterium]|jgi:hypothetical protein